MALQSVHLSRSVACRRGSAASAYHGSRGKCTCKWRAAHLAQHGRQITVAELRSAREAMVGKVGALHPGEGFGIKSIRRDVRTPAPRPTLLASPTMTAAAA